MVRVRDQALDLPLQQSPGGMGFPCGQVFGCPRNVQMRWVQLRADDMFEFAGLRAASESSMEKVSLKRRSAKRWRRTMSRARWVPTEVKLHFPVLHLH